MLEPDDLRAARRAVRDALREDLEGGDATTAALVPPTAKAKGEIVFKEPGVICGLPLAQLVFAKLSRSIKFRYEKGDGDEAAAGEVVAVAYGTARAILTGERTALNFLQRLSGIATLTRAFVKRAGPVRVYDTRKTTPGLRRIEKYAVRTGGGVNHRLSLGAFFVKDNHLAAIGGMDALEGRLPAGAIVEAESPGAAERAARLGAARVLLDNMDAGALKESVRRVRALGRECVLEASGGVTLENVSAVAASGIDCVSVGALTHSARAIDVSLRLKPIS